MAPSIAPAVAAAAAAPERKLRVTVLISGSGSNLGALLAALPSTLSSSLVVHVLSSRPSAYGLTRAAEHSPPIPSSSFSLLAYRKTADASLSKDAVREAFDVELAKRIRRTRPDLVVLAGWMLILSPAFLRDLVRDWDEDAVGGEGEVAAKDSGSDDVREAVATLDVEGVRSLASPGSSPYPTPLAHGTAIPIINLHPALPGQFPGAHAIENAFDAFKAGKIKHTGIMIHRVIPELDAGEAIVVKEVAIVEGEDLDQLATRIHGVEHAAIVEAVAKVGEMLRDGSWWVSDKVEDSLAKLAI